jgi:sulfate adenylyltransferase
MDRTTYDRVLDAEHIVHDGKKYAWTIPLSLPVTADLAKTLKPGQEVALVNSRGRGVWRRSRSPTSFPGTSRAI